MQPAPNFANPTPRAAVGPSFDLSNGDLSSDFGGLVGSTGQLTVTFEYRNEPVTDPNMPDATGQYRVQLLVKLRPHGDRHTESVRRISEKQAQAMFPREYALFTQNDTVMTQGTPLHELPGISQSQIAILVLHNIRCIEDLVSLSTDQIGQIGADARMAHGVAMRWTAAKAGNAELIQDAGDRAQKDARLEQLERESAEKDGTIVRLAAQVEALSRVNPAPAVAQSASGSGTSVAVQSDEPPDQSDPNFMAGAQLVSGSDDLALDPVQLPGLKRASR
jgi:hypothetical protein